MLGLSAGGNQWDAYCGCLLIRTVEILIVDIQYVLSYVLGCGAGWFWGFHGLVLGDCLLPCCNHLQWAAVYFQLSTDATVFLIFKSF